MVKAAKRLPERASFGDPLIIWVQSFCRSTLATYLEIKRQYPGQVYIIIHGKADTDFRAKFGFKSTEFDVSQLHMIDPTISDARSFLEDHTSGLHMFTAYHKSAYYGSKFFNELISNAIEKGVTFFVASEAPQNMESRKLRFLAKEAYIRLGLRMQLARTIEHSQFILSYSGSDTRRLTGMGWQASKIVPFGYFPPPLQQALDGDHHGVGNLVKKKNTLTLLLSGDHSIHKDPLVVVEAAEVLCQRGYRDRFRVLVAGDGTQTKRMKQRTIRGNLPVEFLGFLELAELIAIHDLADVFVASGKSEPWGIRVNDALNLGCPAIVSDGMGAVDLILDTGCGWTFSASNAESLADVIANLIEHPSEIRSRRSQLKSENFISPSFQASRAIEAIKGRLT